MRMGMWLVLGVSAVLVSCGKSEKQESSNTCATQFASAQQSVAGLLASKKNAEAEKALADLEQLFDKGACSGHAESKTVKAYVTNQRQILRGGAPTPPVAPGPMPGPGVPLPGPSVP